MIANSRRVLPLAAAAALLFGAAAATAAPLTVRPMRSPAGKIVYPRIVTGTSAAVRRAVNQLLARQEKADRGQRAECLDQIRAARQKPEADSFSETIAVTYLSARYLSIDVRQSYFCATAYPTTDAPSPVTLDLEDGKALDWNAVFKAGFLPRDGATASATLVKLYRARYVAPPETDACKDFVADDTSFDNGVDLWLDAAKGGLVVQPDFIHVGAACAVPMTFEPADLGAYADPAFVGDLAATVAAAKQK